MYNENEQWYAMQVIPSFEQKIIKAMNDAALETPAEVQIFNPYYRIRQPKSNVPMKAKRKRKSTSQAVYEGYMFFYIDSSDFDVFAGLLSDKLGSIVRIFKDTITEAEIDKVYETVLQLKAKKTEEEILDEETKRLISLDTTEISGKDCVITSGAFQSMKGTVETLNKNRRTAKIILSVFGRATAIELPLEVLQIDL